MDYPSDLSSSDEDDLLLKMNWLRMENDMPPLNKEGVAVLDEEGQIRLTGDSFFRKISPGTFEHVNMCFILVVCQVTCEH